MCSLPPVRQCNAAPTAPFRGLLSSRLALVLLAGLLAAAPARAQRRLEKLDRGVVAIRTGASAVSVSWRLFGTDPSSLAFNVYRGTTKLTPTPLTGATNLTDNATTDEAYTVRPVLNGVEQPASAAASVWGQQYLRIPVQQPAGGTTPDGGAYTYTANDCSVGDLDGDGQYEIILKWDPTNSKDNSHARCAVSGGRGPRKLGLQPAAAPQLFPGYRHGRGAYPPRIVLADSTNNVLGAQVGRADAAGVAVYPNPTTSGVHIRAAGAFSYQAYNLAGQLVEQGAGYDDFTAGQALKPGLYLWRVRAASGAQTTVRVHKE